MNDSAVFLRTILDLPDDDGPRLVFADWLSEQGDSRGEFIHAQCEITRIESMPKKCLLGQRKCAGALSDDGVEPCCDNCRARREAAPRVFDLYRRQGELLRTEAIEWLPELIGATRRCDLSSPGTPLHGWDIDSILEDKRWIGAWFHRGFVNALTLSWDDWSRHAKVLTSTNPIRQVRFTTEADWLGSGGMDGSEDSRRVYLFGPGLTALATYQRWSYEALRLDLDDFGLPNQRTHGEPWRQHVAGRLLKTQWPKIDFIQIALDPRGRRD